MARTVLKGVIKIGFDSGLAKGMIIGEAKGEAKGKIKTASNLKQMGFNIADIVRATGLSKKEIDKLR